jgi:DNA-binding NarL/FixJ family response regulator
LKNSISRKFYIDVIIVDAQPVYSDGLERALSGTGSFQVTGKFTDYRNAAVFIKSNPPHVLIMDIFPGTSKAIDFIAESLKINQNIKIFILSMLDENIYAERALKAGAGGYMMKTAAPREIVSAVEKIYKNELYLSDNLSSMILQKYVGGVENIELNPVKLLSDRELDVYRLTGQGCTSKQISVKLDISVNTVDNHKSGIKEKLGLKNSIELIQSSVLWCRDRGIF